MIMIICKMASHSDMETAYRSVMTIRIYVHNINQ